MKRFRLNIALLLLAMAGAVSGATCLFIFGFWAQGSLVLILAGVCVTVIWRLQSRLIGIMSAFVNALEMNDSTFRIMTGGDSELENMSDAMNRISRIYSRNLRELETRKLYYDRILRIMTHEMRNGITPLTAITSDMKSHPERYKGETLSEAADLIYYQIVNIKRFLDSYYSLTHLPEPKLERIDATSFFAIVRNLANSELKSRGIEKNMISFTVADGLELNIDIGLMNQVMLNLLRNALDAIAEKDDGKIEVVATLSDMHPYLTITDNGGGITPEILTNIFQPFFTTKDGGSGIGLCLSRQIVRRHGGDLSINSQPGKATVVMITL